MKSLIKSLSLGTIAVLFFCSLTLEHASLAYRTSLSEYGQDSLILSNTTIGSGSKIMTDQDGLAVIVPSGHSLASIEIYYSSISTLKSDSSRLLIKSQRSWSCPPLGNANPFIWDQYSIGITNNSKVQVGWNKYEFEVPISIPADTIFIWPDLIQEVKPRVVYAIGNTPELRSMTGTSCANPNASTSSLDYVCKLTFLPNTLCPPFQFVNNSDSTCYYGDTLLANTTIGMSKMVTYFSKNEVQLDTSFEVIEQASLTIDMKGCN